MELRCATGLRFLRVNREFAESQVPISRYQVALYKRFKFGYVSGLRVLLASLNTGRREFASN